MFCDVHEKVTISESEASWLPAPVHVTVYVVVTVGETVVVPLVVGAAFHDIFANPLPPTGDNPAEAPLGKSASVLFAGVLPLPVSVEQFCTPVLPQ